MVDASPNAFHQTMLHLDYGHKEADLFSRACVEQYDDRPIDAYGYLFAQVFEPGVLKEIAALEGSSIELIERLEFGSSLRLEQLRSEIDALPAMTPVRAVNVAACLVSISRFIYAKEVLASITFNKCSSRDQFEIAMLDFVIHNRLADVKGVGKAFRHMRQIIETADLPAARILDAAAQAVVWHLKSAQIDQETFHWFFGLGKRLISQKPQLDAGAKSSWYRAIAMIPAAQGDRRITRELLLQARRTAEEILATRPRAYELHFLKTYHESALKEHMYVSGDRDAALAEADALIALDPIWAPSHGELAEAHQKFGDWEAAAVCFERAGRLGPPYVGHHLFNAAQAWERVGAPEAALSLYGQLLALDNTNPSVLVAGARLGRRLGAAGSEPFEAALARLEGNLKREHREYLNG